MAFMVQDNEKPALEEFREIMKDLVTDEHMLVRFLRARNLNTQKAEQMLRKCMEWRHEKDIDSVKKFEIPSEIVKEFDLYYTGLDADGRPIYVMPIGRWDGRKILNMGLKEESCRFIYRTLETVVDKCKALGVSQFQLIVDYSELTFWKVAHWESLETVLRMVREMEANFPDILYQAHFVNAPSVFWQAFKGVKPLLAQTTMSKIHIFDSDKKRWMEHILQWIPKESLATEYGGTAKAVAFYPTYAEQES